MELRPERQVLFFVLAACIFFAVVFSGTLAAAHLDHDCTAHDFVTTSCLDCFYIKVARNLQKLLQLAVIGFSLAALSVHITRILEKHLSPCFSALSLIGLKVRLDT